MLRLDVKSMELDFSKFQSLLQVSLIRGLHYIVLHYKPYQYGVFAPMHTLVQDQPS